MSFAFLGDEYYGVCPFGFVDLMMFSAVILFIWAVSNSYVFGLAQYRAECINAVPAFGSLP